MLDNGKSERIKADICFDLLDRAGHARTERREVVVDYASKIIEAFERRQARQRVRNASASSREALPAPEGPSGEPPATDRQA